MNVKEFYKNTGSNYEAAVSIMMNDMLIERMLAKFMANNSYNDIIEAYNAHDYKALFALSHSFKGVTGNLALTKLFELASVLTEATRNNENANVDKEIEDLKKAYELIKTEYEKSLA
jgi:HPt (histidine-containing phosphotransfer) domain-containing protein